jgi:hypothetical protein
MSDELHSAFDNDPKGAPVGPKPVNRPRQPMVVHAENLNYRKLANAVCMGVFAGASLTIIIWGLVVFIFGGILIPGAAAGY